MQASRLQNNLRGVVSFQQQFSENLFRLTVCIYSIAHYGKKRKFPAENFRKQPSCGRYGVYLRSKQKRNNGIYCYKKPKRCRYMDYFRDTEFIFRRLADAAAFVDGSKKYPDIQGRVLFYQMKDGVIVRAEVSGLPQGTGKCDSRYSRFISTAAVAARVTAKTLLRMRERITTRRTVRTLITRAICLPFSGQEARRFPYVLPTVSRCRI